MIALAGGSTWGQEKENLILNYKYRLQTVQNQTLRLANGCLSMRSIDYIHQKAKLAIKQFLASNKTHGCRIFTADDYGGCWTLR